MKSAGENPSVLGFIASNQTVYTLGLDTKHLVDNGLPIPLLRTQEQVEMATRAVIATLQGLLLERVTAFTTFSNSLSLIITVCRGRHYNTIPILTGGHGFTSNIFLVRGSLLAGRIKCACTCAPPILPLT